MSRPVTLVTGGLLLVGAAGCATFDQTCEYEAAALVRQHTEAFVLGTGETELATTACAALSYSTQDTGLSDNGKDALGVVAEGVAKGAVSAVVPIP